MKFITTLISFSILSLSAFSLEIPTYHIDFSRLHVVDKKDFIQNISPTISEIKDVLHNPEMGCIEVTGLQEIANREEKKQLFLLMSELLGEVIIQNPNKKELITSITNENREASFAHHNNSVPFHTDGAFFLKPPNILGIWVEEIAINGGETTLINFQDLLLQCSASETGKSVLHLLQSPIPFHVHDSHHEPNTPLCIAAPVISDGLRYRLDLILKGIDETPLENREQLLSAIYFFENSINSHENKLVFLMEEDHMYFFNNKYVLHNRTPFQGRRKIWRTWLQ